MREKGKRLIAIILSCLLLLSNVTVYAATEAEEQSDTQNTVSVNASEEVVTLPEEPINGSAGEEAVIQNEPNAEDTSDETETLAPINATDPLEILETPKNMVGIEISSFNFLPTTRSVGIPTVGSTATGTCYIGDTWNVNYPYQDYFYVNNFTGDLTGAVTVQDFECLDPTAALPTHKNASYEATVTEVNAVGGYIEYYVRVTPPGATDGVTRPDGEHLSGYQHVGGKVRVYRAFAGSLELIKSSANQTITNGNSCYSLKGAVYGLYQNGIEIARKTTDVNGYAKFENVTAGNYDLKEITPPKGYALDKRTYAYFNWMCQLVFDGRYSKKLSYRRLLKVLHKIEFTYSIPMDGNRAEDGIDLRYRFGYENGCSSSMISAYLDNKTCSVLEMMIALAIRCEEHIMDDPDVGNRTGQWFWNMIVNLGLGSMNDSKFDRAYIEEIVQRFLERKYSRNGSGGLFTVNHSRYDLRTVEIWYQMCWYLDENV